MSVIDHNWIGSGNIYSALCRGDFSGKPINFMPLQPSFEREMV